MKTSLAAFVASLAIAMTGAVSPAAAQWAGVAALVPTAAPSGIVTYTYAAAYAACELRRVQIEDEYGWRVRVIAVCAPR